MPLSEAHQFGSYWFPRAVPKQPLILFEGEIPIITITKDESMYLRKVAPNVGIVVLNRQAPARKKCYCVQEEKKVFDLLAAYRQSKRKVVERYGRR